MAARKSPPDATRRELIVTAANIRHNHVYIAGHHDFFPADCIGPVRRPNATVNPPLGRIVAHSSPEERPAKMF